MKEEKALNQEHVCVERGGIRAKGIKEIIKITVIITIADKTVIICQLLF